MNRTWLAGFICCLGLVTETELKHFCNHLIIDFVFLYSGWGCDLGVIVWHVRVLILLGGGVRFALGAGRHGGKVSVPGATRVARVNFTICRHTMV
jgi:hypothetical protein